MTAKKGLSLSPSHFVTLFRPTNKNGASSFVALFRRRRARCSGGALIVTENTTLHVHSTVFTYNFAASRAGAVLVTRGSVADFSGSHFNHNAALDAGGALLVEVGQRRRDKDASAAAL